MVHKQFHMVPSVRRAALTTTTIALLPSFLDIVSTLLSPFPGLASQRLCHRTYHRVMPSRLLYTFAGDYATLASDSKKRRVETTKKERESERTARMHVCARSITVTRPRRSSFSSDEHKSPVMTDRCRSDPSSNRHASHREKMSRGWRSVTKEFLPAYRRFRVYADRRVENLLSLSTTGFYDNRCTSGSSRELVRNRNTCLNIRSRTPSKRLDSNNF